jgi:hypothetical protein
VAKAERPLSVQSRDLRRDVGLRARRAESSRQHDSDRAAGFDPTRTCGNASHMRRGFQRSSLPEPVGSMDGLGRIEHTDGDVVSVRISERKLHSPSAGTHMWLFFQPADEHARPWQGYVKVVDPEEQEEAVARLGVVGTCQRGMLVGAQRRGRSTLISGPPELERAHLAIRHPPAGRQRVRPAQLTLSDPLHGEQTHRRSCGLG